MRGARPSRGENGDPPNLKGWAGAARALNCPPPTSTEVADSTPRAATPQSGALKVMTRDRVAVAELHNAKRRLWYARRRVRQLRERLPELPKEVTPDLLVYLRRISVAAFRAGGGKQTLLSPFTLESPCSPRATMGVPGGPESVSTPTSGQASDTS